MNINIHFAQSTSSKNKSYYLISEIHPWSNNQNKLNKRNNFVSHIKVSPKKNIVKPAMTECHDTLAMTRSATTHWQWQRVPQHTDNGTKCHDTDNGTECHDTLIMALSAMALTMVPSAMTLTMALSAMTHWQWPWVPWHTDNGTECRDTLTMALSAVTHWQWPWVSQHTDTDTECHEDLTTCSRHAAPPTPLTAAGTSFPSIFPMRTKKLTKSRAAFAWASFLLVELPTPT